MRYIIEKAINAKGDECVGWPYSRDIHGRAKVYFRGDMQTAARVVCIMIHGEPPSSMHVAAHSCGKGHEGCVSGGHLSWETHIENMGDKVAHGTSNRGENQANSKLTETIVLEIMALKNKLSQKKIGNIYGVSAGTICAIHAGRNWGWLTNPENK